MAQPVEPDEELVDRKLNRSRSRSTPNSTGKGLGRPPAQPVEGAKNFLFLPKRLFNWSRSDQGSVKVRSRGGRGPTTTCQALNVNGQSTGRTPKRLVWFFSSIKRLQSSLFKKLNLPKPFLIIFEPWKSVSECTIVLKLAYPQCTFQSQFSCII